MGRAAPDIADGMRVLVDALELSQLSQHPGGGGTTRRYVMSRFLPGRKGSTAAVVG